MGKLQFWRAKNRVVSDRGPLALRNFEKSIPRVATHSLTSNLLDLSDLTVK